MWGVGNAIGCILDSAYAKSSTSRVWLLLFPFFYSFSHVFKASCSLLGCIFTGVHPTTSLDEHTFSRDFCVSNKQRLEASLFKLFLGGQFISTASVYETLQSIWTVAEPKHSDILSINAVNIPLSVQNETFKKNSSTTVFHSMITTPASLISCTHVR